MKTNRLNWLILIILAAFLLAFPRLFTQPFLQRTMILILLWSVLGLAWNMIGGYAGQVSLGHAIFFGLGAYTSTLILTKWDISPWIGMFGGVVVAVVVSAIIGWPSFRLAGHYFAIATIAAGEIFAVMFRNWRWAGGAVGVYLPIIRGERIANFQFHEAKYGYYYIILAMLAITMLATYLIERSRIGYYLKAIREDPDAARSLGINITRYKLYAIMLSAAFTAIAGTFYAQFVLYISPNTVFALLFSIQMCLVAVLGGTGTLAGPIIGAAILIPMAEYTRVYLAGRAGGLHLVVYGLLIMLISIYQPGGLMGLVRQWQQRWSTRAQRRDAAVAVPAHHRLERSEGSGDVTDGAS
ncbi:MAG: High-affinity branched-chain amino acid transport system permease protein LivH [Anaerolineales bacterium]|nr:High-affinity branched-chain amino acid transport system permease protein LivH [Anaerolineales bacterium]